MHLDVKSTKPCRSHKKTTSEMNYYLLTRMFLFPQLIQVQIQFRLYCNTVLTVLSVNVYIIQTHSHVHTQPFDAVNISAEN